MNLVFVSSEKYPNGGAAANRHMAYAKGLVEAGHLVHFVLLSKQITRNSEYIEEGIEYICAFPVRYGSSYNKIKKLSLLLRSINARKKILLRLHKEKKIDTIILLDTLARILIPLISFAKKNHIKVIHERTEYPFVVSGKGLMMKINLKIYLSYVLKKFDGIYVITQALKTYFDKLLGNTIPIVIINMIIDPARFKEVKTGCVQNDQYIAYCGSMDDDKDGVDILIKAFRDALIKKRINNDTRLMLIGNVNHEAFKKKLDKIFEQKDYLNNIILTGKIERIKVPGLLNDAAALALARPNNKQAEGGFPTKLGEYLATGKPVIITDVGEICNFLTDGYNAFVAKPGDVDSFSEKISEVFADYSKALEIGKNGESLIYNEFNYFKQAVKLAEFIESL